MFDIAWSELMVIAIVAMVVVGPKDLPKMMRKAGQWAAKARGMADQFKRSFDDMARQSELDELRNQVSQLKSATARPMADIEQATQGMSDPIRSIQSSIEDVGAAPPKFDSPAAASAPAAQPTSAS